MNFIEYAKFYTGLLLCVIVTKIAIEELGSNGDYLIPVIVGGLCTDKIIRELRKDRR